MVSKLIPTYDILTGKQTGIKKVWKVITASNTTAKVVIAVKDDKDNITDCCLVYSFSEYDELPTTED